MNYVGSVALVSSSGGLGMPEAIVEVPTLFPFLHSASFLHPVLAVVYNCAQIMKRTSIHLEEISSAFNLSKPKANPSLPPCFFARENI